MPSHSERPGIWLSVWRFLLTHCMYERAAEVLARLRRCAGSPEPSLLAYAISTKFAWRGPNGQSNKNKIPLSGKHLTGTVTFCCNIEWAWSFCWLCSVTGGVSWTSFRFIGTWVGIRKWTAGVCMINLGRQVSLGQIDIFLIECIVLFSWSNIWTIYCEAAYPAQFTVNLRNSCFRA